MLEFVVLRKIYRSYKKYQNTIYYTHYIVCVINGVLVFCFYLFFSVSEGISSLTDEMLATTTTFGG